MSDTFYIIITVIFGVFVLLTLWWMYRYINRKSILETKQEDLSDDQKLLLSKFCNEMRRERIIKEEAEEKTGKVKEPSKKRK